MNPLVNQYFDRARRWHDEMKRLRKVVLDCGLLETWKWRSPCYTHRDKNLLLIAGFKEYCALNFFKGGLLKDDRKLLVKPGEHTQAGRQIRFTEMAEIVELEATLKEYIREAMEVEDSGAKSTQAGLPDIPEEWQGQLDGNPALKKAFEKLTPGRQRAYLIYFSAPKQSQTRTARMEKYIPRILTGKGFNDCVCGLSRKMPQCDGSHKLRE